MPNPYRLLYQVGFTPWDGKTEVAPLGDLLDTLTPGRALDMGCGTGRHALFMAARGWDVVGVDGVPKALRRAEQRAAGAGGAGSRVRFLRGDVTRLGATLHPQTFDLVTDVGCFHGLSEAERNRCLSELRPYTRAGTALFIFAVAPRRGIGPSGLNESDMRRYAGDTWTLEKTIEAAPVNTKSPLGNAPFRWYLLRRTD
jgi:SAM-dependent methyltransferase